MVVYIGGSTPFQVLSASSQTLGVAGTTVTISSVDFQSGGTVVVLFVRSNVAGNAHTVSSVTINGTAASLVIAAAGTAVAADAQAYEAASVAGGTGNVSIVFSGSEVWTAVYGIYLVGSRTLEDSDSQNASVTTLTQSVNVSADGAVMSTFLFWLNNSALAFTGGVDEDVRATVTATNRPGNVGSRAYPSSATPASVTSGSSSAATLRAVTVSYS